MRTKAVVNDARVGVEANAPDMGLLGRYATERSPLAMAATEGPRHLLRYANASFCRLCDKPREELVGRPFAEIPSYAEEQGFLPLLDRVYRTGEPESFVEQKHLLANQSPVYLSYAVWAVPDEAERPAGLMIQMTDTSEAVGLYQDYERADAQIREINQALVIAGVHQQELAEAAAAAQQQLLQAQKMESIGRLAGGIAHDFNNLLTVIVGFTQLSEKTLLPEDKVQGYLQKIATAAERAAALTRQLLAFARKQIIEPQVLLLDTMIFDIDEMLRRLIGEDIELVTLPRAEGGRVKVDAGQLTQVLINLVVNARDAMPQGGKLVIETANVTLDDDDARRHADVVPGDYVLLAVSDTGTGMSEEVKGYVFEPFFTTKPQGKGTGLGLATCYGIVKQSSGHMWFDSEVGQGTTFLIYLPRREETARHAQQRETSSLLQGTETILLAEDEPLVRSIAAQTLRLHGYTVLEAANGQEALDLVAEHRVEPDLLVTDVVMPQMGGRELVDRLQFAYPRLKVLYISGYTADAIVHQGMLDPDLAFLHKPFTPAELASRVRAVLGSASG